jgi:hypothetical protein
VQTRATPSQASLGWLEVWRIALLHPSRATFSRIANDPRASVKWGIVWMAIASIVYWFVGPQRPLLTGWVADSFGLDASGRFPLVGAVVALHLGVIWLMIAASISHGLARLFSGAGTLCQLVYCWAGVLPPYLLLFGLVTYFPAIFPSPPAFMFSSGWIAIQFATLFMLAGILLYLSYAEVVAFSAVERIGVAKGLGILILQALTLGVALVASLLVAGG